MLVFGLSIVHATQGSAAKYLSLLTASLCGTVSARLETGGRCVRPSEETRVRHHIAWRMFEQDQFLSALFCVHQLCLIVFLSVFWFGFVSCFLCLLLRCSHVDETRPSDFAQEMHLVYRPSWRSWQAIFAVQPCKYASRKTLEVRERSLYLEECAASIPTQTNNRFDVQLHRHIFSSSFKFFWRALRCRRKQTRT